MRGWNNTHINLLLVYSTTRYAYRPTAEKKQHGSIANSILLLANYCKSIATMTKYVSPPYCRAEMYSGHIAYCPMVSSES